MKRTAFIAIVGRPNVGKSTLLNSLLGEKVSMVSSKPQTTRNRITGILSSGDDQYVFLDTPGVHRPHNKLGEFMDKTALSALSDSDIAILTVEAGDKVGPTERNIIDQIRSGGMHSILVINKTDVSTPEKIAETIRMFSEYYSFDAVVPIGAKKNDGTDIVLKEASAFLTEHEWFFPEGIFTDQPERQYAAEVIREKLLRTLDKEVPHGTAVMIEDFKDEESIIRIRAEIFCEKDSHKGIIVGKNGETLKTIGTRAREDLELFFGTKVYLNLWVKVKRNWRDSEANITNFGYTMD